MRELFKKFNFKNFEIKRGKRPLIFVHTDTDLSSVAERKDLILSPAYYWCKKEELEISSLRKAKKLSESIFFSNLPEGDYKYKTVKKEDKFFFFAYNEKSILDALKSQGLKEEFIGDIYFAQNEITTDRAVKISENFAIIHKDEMTLTLPISYTQDPVDFSSLNIKLSNNYIRLKVAVIGKEKNEKLYLVASVFVGVWLILELAGSYRLSSELSALEGKEASVYEKYELPSTSFQVEAIKNKYSKTEKEQSSIRDALTILSSYKTSTKEHFKEVKLESKKFTAILHSEKNREQELKRSFKNSTVKKEKDSFKVEIKL